MHWARPLLLLTFASAYVAASPNFLTGREGNGSGHGRGGGDDDGGNDADDDDGGPSTSASSNSPSPTASSNSTTSASSGNSTSQLTGGSVCSQYMCITAVVNGSTTEYTLQSTNAATLGWMAMGFGQQMTNSPMVIMWANSDGSLTLSQRKASQAVMPVVDPNPPQIATAVPSQSKLTGTNASFVYTIPSTTSASSQGIIWAFGNTNPENSAVDAALNIHIDSGPLMLDLSAPATVNANGTATPPPPSGSGQASVPLLPYQKKIVAHGILSVVGFLGLLPLGALVARYCRAFTPVWFQGHWIIQVVLAGPVIISGVALGFAAVHAEGAQGLSDDHMRWGLAIFVLYFLQLILGAVIHFCKPRSAVERHKRPVQNYFHAIVGLLIIGLSFYQVRTGFRTEWPKTTGRGNIANGANIVWIVWVALISALYLAGLALLPRQFRQESAYKADPVATQDAEEMTER